MPDQYHVTFREPVSRLTVFVTCQQHEEIVENMGVWHRLREGRHETRHVEGTEVVLCNYEEMVSDMETWTLLNGLCLH
jgi:hypothetical protein